MSEPTFFRDAPFYIFYAPKLLSRISTATRHHASHWRRRPAQLLRWRSAEERRCLEWHRDGVGGSVNRAAARAAAARAAAARAAAGYVSEEGSCEMGGSRRDTTVDLDANAIITRSNGRRPRRKPLGWEMWRVQRRRGLLVLLPRWRRVRLEELLPRLWREWVVQGRASAERVVVRLHMRCFIAQTRVPESIPRRRDRTELIEHGELRRWLRWRVGGGEGRLRTLRRL